MVASVAIDLLHVIVTNGEIGHGSLNLAIYSIYVDFICRVKLCHILVVNPDRLISNSMYLKMLFFSLLSNIKN